MKGFYKKDNDCWLYGQVIYYPDGLIVNEENKEEVRDGWVWYDTAPQAYIDWWNTMYGEQTGSIQY